MAEQSASVIRQQLEANAELVKLVHAQSVLVDGLTGAVMENANKIETLDASQVEQRIEQRTAQTSAAQALAVQLLRLEASVDKVGAGLQELHRNQQQRGGVAPQSEGSKRHAELRADLSRIEDTVTEVTEKLRRVEMVVNGESATLGIRSVFQRQSVVIAAHRYQNMRNSDSSQSRSSSSSSSNDDDESESAGHRQRKQRQRQAQHQPTTPPHGERERPSQNPTPAAERQQMHKEKQRSKFMEAVEGQADHVVSKESPGPRRKLQSVASAMDTSSPSSPAATVAMVELQVMIPTFKRLYSTDPHEYLRKVLKSIGLQYQAHVAKQRAQGGTAPRSIVAVVVNTGPAEHLGVEQAIEEAARGTGLTVKYEEVEHQFTDPYPADYHVKVDYDNRKDILESWPPSRKHSMHLAEVLLKAQQIDSKYTLLVEDDMVWCSAHNTAANNMNINGGDALSRIWDAIDHANAAAPSWTGVRVGYGGNGLVLPSSDLSALTDYLLANMHRRPPDWLLTEWYKGKTFTSKASLGDRHSGFTYKFNLFEHIGEHSAFPGREKQASKRDAASDSNAAGKVEFTIPQCFEFNWYLLPEERFDTARCQNKLFTPC